MIVFYRDRFHRGDLPIPPESPMLRYGVGVFETLLWIHGRLVRVKEHLARAEGGLAALELGDLPKDLEVLLSEVVERNHLAHGMARVNLLLGPEREGGAVIPMATAAAYDPPPLEPVEILVTDTVHLCSMARFKTLSYLPYREATRRARSMGAWDAAFVDCDGHLMETGTAALLLQDDEGLVTPASPWKLSSISLAAVAAQRPIREIPVGLDELGRFRFVWIVNSLVGALPVDRFGDQNFVPEPESAAALRGIVWDMDEDLGEGS